MLNDLETPAQKRVLIFMGVSGCGKSTVAKLFCDRTGAVFIEGDDFHPAENKAKMSAGIPLTDEDRLPWLNVLGGMIQGLLNKNVLGAVSCSALKQKYRDILQGQDERVKFVFLHASQEILQARLEARTNHFMSPKLLASQLATLEPPQDAWAYEITRPVEEIVNDLLIKISTI